MKKARINKMINRIVSIKAHLDMIETDPLLVEAYESDLDQLKSEYGSFINDLLFEIYDDVCEDDEIQSIEQYLSRKGVEVQADDFPGVIAVLKMKANPLRFELESPDHEYKEIVWADYIEAA